MNIYYIHGSGVFVTMYSYGWWWTFCCPCLFETGFYVAQTKFAQPKLSRNS